MSRWGIYSKVATTRQGRDMTTSWHSYPSIFAIGHRALAELLLDPVIVEEKVDGSQFSFGLFDGELKARSKGAVLNIDAPEKMFTRAVNTIRELPLQDGWTYRAEYLQKPKHNTLAYERIPDKHLILFDVNTGHEEYMPYAEKSAEAVRLGLEVVPLMFEGMVESAQQFRDMLDTVSALGGQKIEGIVVKNYARFGPDKKALMGKFVSEAFKEIHGKDWKERNPGKLDVVQALIESYRTPARWNKAIQHLREAGNLDGSPRDIGNLIKEVQADIQKECAEEIAEKLYQWALPQIRRGVTAGLPEWYKDELLKQQFSEAAE